MLKERRVVAILHHSGDHPSSNLTARQLNVHSQAAGPFTLRGEGIAWRTVCQTCVVKAEDIHCMLLRRVAQDSCFELLQMALHECLATCSSFVTTRTNYAIPSGSLASCKLHASLDVL
jgi:hypothetical protein